MEVEGGPIVSIEIELKQRDDDLLFGLSTDPGCYHFEVSEDGCSIVFYFDISSHLCDVRITGSSRKLTSSSLKSLKVSTLN